MPGRLSTSYVSLMTPVEPQNLSEGWGKEPSFTRLSSDLHTSAPCVPPIPDNKNNKWVFFKKEEIEIGGGKETGVCRKL